MINLFHVITGLGVGGAETSLLKAIQHRDHSVYNVTVVSLLPEGPLADKMREAGARVESLEMTKSFPNPAAILRLRRLLAENRAEIVHCWMYHANLVGGLAAKWVGLPSIWGIRHANFSRQGNSLRTRAVIRASSSLSGVLADAVIYCAERARLVHEEIGYSRKQSLVIPNGFELEFFHPAPQQRNDVRRELGLDEESFLIGMAGRFDPLKNHANFLQAAEAFTDSGRRAMFVLCGDGVCRENDEFARLIPERISRRVLTLGRREDMPRLLSALDIGTLSSDGEAFPLVAGETMACEVPFVGTDVGDMAFVIGDTGVVVPPGDPQALAAGWAEIYDLAPDARIMLGKRARSRIREKFDINEVTSRYEDVYRALLTGQTIL